MGVNRNAVSTGDLNQLQIVTREQGTTVMIELAGEWDLAGAPAVRQAIGSGLTGRPECVVLDLSRLAFIDSSGLHVMIELAGRSAAQNVRLVIIPGPRAVQRVFEITGLAERLPFLDTESTGSRTARSRNARHGAAGSGAISLPPNGAGRHPQAAGAAPGTRSARPASTRWSSPTSARRGRPSIS
jgi:anti-sigma B factor antagonist